MTKNTLLIALMAGLLATGSAFAQTSSDNSMAGDSTAAPMDGASAPMKKHRMQRHGTNKSSNGLSANKSKTPAVETGASAAVENGQGK
jgi:hypothetical protein